MFWDIDSMKGAALFSGLVSGILVSGTFLPIKAVAQISSDGTTNTTVNSNSNNFTILNGIKKGDNLFHSFRDFSVPRGGSASFDLNQTPKQQTHLRFAIAPPIHLLQ